MEQKAKLLMTQDGQAVYLPEEFQFQGEEVYISRDKNTGNVILSKTNGLSPNAPKTWDEFFNSLPKGRSFKDFDVGERQPVDFRDPFDRNPSK